MTVRDRFLRTLRGPRPEGLKAPDMGSLPPELNDRLLLYSGVSSPMVCVGGMMQFERFLELCLSDLQLVKELTAICLARILDALDVLLSTRRIEYLWMGDCQWLTPPMGSPTMYRDRMVFQSTAGPIGAVTPRMLRNYRRMLDI